MVKNTGTVTVLGMSLLGCCLTADAKTPNIAFILADDFGWGDLGVLWSRGSSGDKVPVTPRLDSLAEDGILFDAFHVMNPVCSPSRASFFTGQFPTTVGGMVDFLGLDVPTLPRLLKEGMGYRTAHYGKWHMGQTNDAPWPSEYGLDDAVTYWSNPSSPQLGTMEDPWFPSNSSRQIVDHAIFFARNATSHGDPFYVALWFHISHAPLNPTEEQMKGFDSLHYCPWSGIFPDSYDPFYPRCPIQILRSSQHDLDTQTGRFLDFLKEEGLENDTIVFFSTDNGPEDEQVYFNSVGSSGPFRGRKRSLYEGGVRVPSMLRWPGHVAAGRVTDADAASVDMIPTIAGLVGMKLDPSVEKVLVGRDFSDFLLGGKPLPPRTIPLMFDWRFEVNGHCWNEAPRLAIRDEGNGVKLLVNPELDRVEMFNLSDVFESQNLVSEHPWLADSLTKKVVDWMKTQPPTPPQNIVHHLGCQHKP